MLGIIPGVWAQQTLYAPEGLPFIQRWRPVDYNAHGQNWSFAQDTSGVLYVGNTSGLLEYDGVSWTLTRTPLSSAVRSLAVRGDGTLFVGAQNEIAYRTTDARGQSALISLMEHVPERMRDFSDVWRTFVVDDVVYFHTHEALFGWDGTQMHVWEPQGLFRMAFLIENQLYLRDTGRGLVRMEGQEIVLLPGTEEFADRVVFVVLPLGDGRILVGGGSHPLMVYDGAAVEPFAAPEAQAFATASFVYHGNRLSDGRLLLGSIGNGAIVMDPDGTLSRRLTRAEGLNDNIVISSFEDPQGGVWMGHESGLSRVELHSPFTYFDQDRSGLPGSQRALAWHNGRLYMANPGGLFRQRIPAPGHAPMFEPITDHEALIYDLLSFDSQLLIAAGDAMYSRRGERSVEVLPDNSLTLLRSRSDSTRVFVGLQNALTSIRWDGAAWNDEGPVPGLQAEVRWIQEDDEGTVWAGTTYDGVWRISFGEGDRQQPVVEQFMDREGLPGNTVNVYRLGSDLVFSAEGDLYRYREDAAPAFVPDDRFAMVEEANIGGVIWAVDDPVGRFWLTTSTEISYLQPTDASDAFMWERTPLRRLASYRFVQTDWGADGAAWIFASDAVIRYDPSKPHQASAMAPFATMLRKATAGGDTLFAGQIPTDLRSTSPSLPIEKSGLVFSFSAPRYDLPHETSYQVRLDGFDDAWSEWSQATTKEYTALPEGRYTFRVKARDVYGIEGKEASFAFAVLPPWYRTWWAYGLYLGLLGVAVYGVSQWRIRRLQAQTVELEALVQERTQTIETQAERLREMDRMKSRLFANISHEFRTPLTLTIGPLRDLQQEETLTNHGARKVDLALRNARRLLRLINQLLDITKIEAGRMEVKLEAGDFAEEVRGLVQAFAALAEREKVALTFKATPPLLPAAFDPDMLEKVVINLLSNAFKFTPSEGAVRVSVVQDNDQAVLTVQDTGIGIAAEKLPHLFDRFYQVEDTNTRGYEGTGIGLSLVKELVELHGGTVAIASVLDEGTTCTVRWPLGAPGANGQAADGKQESAESEGKGIQRALAAAAAGNPTAWESEEKVLDAATDSQDVTTVLIVDDHPEIRAYVREHLQASYRVLEAADGVAGLETAHDALPDLIISDVMMPRLDGYGFCAAVKADPVLDCIPFILLTARAEGEDKLEGLGTGADDYVTKPFDVRELRLRVDNQIAARLRLRQRLADERSPLHVVVPSEPDVISADEALLEQARAIVEAHIDDEAFSVEALASELGLSRSQMHRRLKDLTGQPAGAFLRGLRLGRAAQLLEANAGTVSEVAYAVGFRSLSHFSKCFRQQYGVLPSAFAASQEAGS